MPFGAARRALDSAAFGARSLSGETIAFGARGCNASSMLASETRAHQPPVHVFVPGGRTRRPGPRSVRARIGLAALTVAALAIVVHHVGESTAPPSAADVVGAKTTLDSLGSPLAGAQEAGNAVYWPCPNHGCAQVVKVFSLTHPPLRDVVDALGAWAARAGLHGGDAEIIQCPGSQAVPKNFAPVGDCTGGWLLQDGTEVDVHLRLSTPVPQSYIDARGDLVGGGPWTEYATATVSQAWTEIATGRPGED